MSNTVTYMPVYEVVSGDLKAKTLFTDTDRMARFLVFMSRNDIKTTVNYHGGLYECPIIAGSVVHYSGKNFNVVIESEL